MVGRTFFTVRLNGPVLREGTTEDEEAGNLHGDETDDYVADYNLNEGILEGPTAGAVNLMFGKWRMRKGLLGEWRCLTHVIL